MQKKRRKFLAGIVLLDIIDYYWIIVKVNLKARGCTEFTKITLPLQDGNIFCASGLHTSFNSDGKIKNHSIHPE